MDGPATVALSKKLARVLRHRVFEHGLGSVLRPDGFVPLAALLATPAFSGVTVHDVQRVVAENDKQRFALRADATDGVLLIRANQGHTLVDGVDDEALLDRLPPPPEGPLVAVHGTNRSALAAIAASGGLSRMARRHIHLAADLPGSSGVISGMRASADVHIWVDLGFAHGSGVRLYVSANGVLLTPGLQPGAQPGPQPGPSEQGLLPCAHFARVLDARSGQRLPGPWDEARAALGGGSAALRLAAVDAAVDAAEAAAGKGALARGVPSARAVRRPGPSAESQLGRAAAAATAAADPAGESGPAPFAACFATALALLPPPHLWPPLQRLRGARPSGAAAAALSQPAGPGAAAGAGPGAERQAHRDKAFLRWPPHVNLLYPFVPLPDFARAAEAIAAALSSRPQLGPPGLRLAAPERFAHGRGRPCTVWLRPEPSGALADAEAGPAAAGGTSPAGPAQPPFAQLQELHSALAQAVPLAVGRRHGRGQPRAGAAPSQPFVPHLTVGQWAAGEELSAALAQLAAEWEPVQWRADCLSLLSRAGPDEPFAVHARVWFADPGGSGEGAARWELLEPPEVYSPVSPE